MARPVKDGLDYFPKDTGFYHDPKIRALIGRFGSDGAVLYDYLLCEAYGRNGYYIEMDDLFIDIIAADLGMSPEKIGLILGYLLNKSMLLDGTLFKAVKVLTSHGIQTRYQEAVRGRAKKRGISVDGELWLLNEAETESFIKVRQNGDLSGNNVDKSEKNTGFSREESPKEKKEKERKEKERKVGSAYGRDSAVAAVFRAYEEKISRQMTEGIRDGLMTFLSVMGPECCIRAMDAAIEAGKVSWYYVRSVLEAKRAQGVRSLADWDAAEARREGERHGKIQPAAGAGGETFKGWRAKSALDDAPGVGAQEDG